MSEKSKRRARIWNRYICPAIEYAIYAVGAIAAAACFWLICVATILVFG
jgi:hypothetical protein